MVSDDAGGFACGIACVDLLLRKGLKRHPMSSDAKLGELGEVHLGQHPMCRMLRDVKSDIANSKSDTRGKESLTGVQWWCVLLQWALQLSVSV